MAIKGVLLDLGGVLYVGRQALPGAADALVRLRKHGLPLRFLTNTTRSTRRAVAGRLKRMAFVIAEEEIFTAPAAALDEIRRRALRPYLLIHPDLAPELESVETEPPNAVLVGDAGEAFTYERMNRAFRLVADGAPLLAMSRARYFREDDGLSLDAGPFVAALEYAAGVEAEVLGKPAPGFYRAAVAALGCRPEATVMVGDDVEADVHGAVDAGLQGLLVRTGKYRPGDERVLGDRGEAADDLAAAVDWIIARAS
ncbi:MAG: TIGR01458 family HAD-type hydrolase [Gammaproteobacteria bacterium]|nr:TIGR01458 family HAD-type hydrolase [Gammaproteobacteria bacterium]